MKKINQENTINKRSERYYGYDEPREYNVGFLPHKSGKYRIEIDSAIEHVSQFSTAIQILQQAKEDDEIEIHLQCPGGSTDASGAFVHALNKCVAQVHIIASGGVHSAAVDILLCADSFELAENFNCLIHNGGSGSIGNINEYLAKSDFDKEFIKKQQTDILEGFLTPSEIEGVLRGDNLWLDAQQWCDRAVNRMEYFQTKWQKLEKEAKKASRPKRVKKPVVQKSLDKPAQVAE